MDSVVAECRLSCSHGMWDLSSPTRNRTCVPCIGMCLCAHSVASNSAMPWTVVHQAPMSMELPRHEYWSSLPFPSPRDFSTPRDQLPGSCISCTGRQIFTTLPPGKPPALEGGFLTTGPPGKSYGMHILAFAGSHLVTRRVPQPLASAYQLLNGLVGWMFLFFSCCHWTSCRSPS